MRPKPGHLLSEEPLITDMGIYIKLILYHQTRVSNLRELRQRYCGCG